MGARAAHTAGGFALSSYGSADVERYVVEDTARKRSDRDDFTRDAARVVHSASLRRLSTKTQVWQAGTDDFVRNRLTHSLEVAQIGRELAAALGCDRDVVDAACLAHDIGHPPFGHFGESVLDELAAGIGGFEGNAQTFRLLTRLEAKRFDEAGRSVGLNLTRATLDASIKYPWARAQGPGGSKKFGVYADDREIFDFVRGGGGTAAGALAEAGVAGETCLEAQVMDWADDVAYSVHDVEDALAAGAVAAGALRSRDERAQIAVQARSRYAPDFGDAILEQAIDDLVANDLPEHFAGSRRDLAALKDMTSTLIGRFAAAAEDATRARYGHAPLVRYEASLVVPQDVRAQVAVLKGMAAHFVMFTGAREAEHARQREVIERLVSAFSADPSLLDRPFADDLEAARNEAERLRVVIDQVASLTDGRAVALAAQLG